MGSVTNDKKRKRIQVTISASDIEKTWGPDASLALVKQWITLGRERQNSQCLVASQTEILSEAISNLEQDVQEIQASLARLTALLLHTSKLINIASTLPHYDLEVLRARKKRGDLNEQEASKHLLAEIKEENFERFIAENFPGKDANRFLATSTKSKG